MLAIVGKEIAEVIAPIAKWGALATVVLVAGWYGWRRARKVLKGSVIAQQAGEATEIEEEASAHLDATTGRGPSGILARVRARRRRRERLRH